METLVLIKIKYYKNFNFKTFILLFLAGFSSLINGQQVKFSGKVTDTLQKPLPYTNILAIPKADDQDVKFAITEKDGSFKLGLVKNQTYELTVSYLGYKPLTLTIKTIDRNDFKIIDYAINDYLKSLIFKE